MAAKETAIPKTLLAVAWIPELEASPITQAEVLSIGGRMVDHNLSKSGAEEVVRCLNYGTEGNGYGGKYIAIKQ